MKFDEIKPMSTGWNQIKSELVRNVTEFEMIEQNTKDEELTHASKLRELMEISLEEMSRLE